MPVMHPSIYRVLYTVLQSHHQQQQQQPPTTTTTSIHIIRRTFFAWWLPIGRSDKAKYIFVPIFGLVYRLPISIASSTNLVLEIFHPHECVWMCLGCPPHSAGSVQRRLMLWYYIGIHSSDVASSQIHRVNFKLNSEIFHPNRLDRILFVYCGNVSSQSNWKMFVIRYYSECVEHIEMAIRPWSIKRSFSRISRYFLHVCSIQFKFVIFFVSIIEICQPTSSG